jgi:predicted esterase
VALSEAAGIKPVKGVACFSGYFITHDMFSHESLERTQVLMVHSQKDTMLPFQLASYGYHEQLVKQLKVRHSQFLIFENKDGHGHEFNEDTVALLMRFVNKGLPVQATGIETRRKVDYRGRQEL